MIWKREKRRKVLVTERRARYPEKYYDFINVPFEFIKISSLPSSTIVQKVCLETQNLKPGKQNKLKTLTFFLWFNSKSKHCPEEGSVSILRARSDSHLLSQLCSKGELCCESVMKIFQKMRQSRFKFSRKVPLGFYNK